VPLVATTVIPQSPSRLRVRLTTRPYRSPRQEPVACGPGASAVAGVDVGAPELLELRLDLIVYLRASAAFEPKLVLRPNIRLIQCLPLNADVDVGGPDTRFSDHRYEGVGEVWVALRLPRPIRRIARRVAIGSPGRATGVVVVTFAPSPVRRTAA